MATTTPQREQGLAWLARQLRWEQSLDALRSGTDAPREERQAA